MGGVECSICLAQAPDPNEDGPPIACDENIVVFLNHTIIDSNWIVLLSAVLPTLMRDERKIAKVSAWFAWGGTSVWMGGLWLLCMTCVIIGYIDSLGGSAEGWKSCRGSVSFTEIVSICAWIIGDHNGSSCKEVGVDMCGSPKSKHTWCLHCWVWLLIWLWY